MSGAADASADTGPRFAWTRCPRNPIFPATPGTWRESQAANPDLLLLGDTWHLYFRGQSGGHDRIGVATAHRDRFDGETWEIRSEPVIDVGAPGSWVEQHVLDPAAVVHDGRVFLYYSAVSPRCGRAVCLAVSEDGIHFRKHPGSDGFQVHLATSRDGLAFDGSEPPIALPVGAPGTWDSFTVETPRIFREGGLFYLLYCGSDRHADYPFHAGLATSTDLRHWEKYPGNPVFDRGAAGARDEGATWFTTVERIGGRYHLWYEGYGGGTVRTEAYGSYLRGGRSQVGYATMDAPYFYVRPPGQQFSVKGVRRVPRPYLVHEGPLRALHPENYRTFVGASEHCRLVKHFPAWEGKSRSGDRSGCDSPSCYDAWQSTSIASPTPASRRR